MIIKMPESELLDLIRKTDKGTLYSNSTKVFESHFNNFKFNKKWEKDSSYKFIKACFSEIIKQKVKLLDIGCHVGPLPMFLKKQNLWNQVEYFGTDIVPNALKIAELNFPEGNFFISNVESLKIKDYYDIVFSKGTIISTFYPNKALHSILDIPSKYVLLAHQPFFKKKSDKSFENILVVTKNSMYTSSVLYYDYFIKEIERRNIKIIKMKKRIFPTRVQNFNNYHLYDILLKK